MRRIYMVSLLAMLCISLMGQNNPFIEIGKTWHVRFYSHGQLWLQTYYEGPYEEYDLYFGEERDYDKENNSVKADTVIAGKEYRKLYKDKGGNQTVAAMLREEDGKVFRWSASDGREWLLYDFTLQDGDMFNLPGNGKEDYFVCNVTKTDTLNISGHSLKRIVFKAKVSEHYDEKEYEEDGGVGYEDEYDEDWSDVSTNVWIEGVGCLNGDPLNNVVDANLVGGGMDLSPYVYTATDFYSFSFDFQGIRGCELVAGEDVTDELLGDKWGVDSLHYELLANEDGGANRSDTLHISGYIWLDSAPRHYLYCYNDFNINSTVTFERVSVGAAASDMRAYRVDLRLLAFYKDYHYTAMDGEGKHPLSRITASVPFVMPLSSTNQGAFNLSGQPVNVMPHRGIVVRNGKKVLVR